MNRPDLVLKHKKNLDMIGCAKLDPDTLIIPTFTCDINKGVCKANGVKKDACARMYMDGSLLLGHSKLQILMELVSLIEAIFVVMGKPDTLIRQYPPAMDKWSDLIIGPVQTMLGLRINTYKLTIGIPTG